MDDPIRASYIYVLVLITLLIVFAASWMGIYLARQITVPVQLLAEGTEKVASGDLDVRLDYRSDDELGTLVASFNRMIADLKEMKANLEGANVSLSSTYDELRRRTRFIETILTNISTGVIVMRHTGATLPAAAHQIVKFGERGTLSAALTAAGFHEVKEELRTVPWVWTSTIEDLWEYFQAATVPFRSLFDQIRPEQCEPITRDVCAAFARYWDGEKVNLTADFVLASGVR